MSGVMKEWVNLSSNNFDNYSRKLKGFGAGTKAEKINFPSQIIHERHRFD